MKLNGKSLAVTAGLILLAAIVIFIEIAIFISGPTRKYEDKVAQQMDTIHASYTEIQNLKRHVFHYVMYIGEDAENYVWFNEKGTAITSRKKNTLREAEVTALMQKNYQGKEMDIRLGYGYEGPVYVVNFEQGEVLLDYDNLKEIYYLKKGE